MNIVKKMLKNHETPVRVPKRTQEIVPIEAVYEDGLFYLGHGNYSMCYHFSDVNYTSASTEQKSNMLVEYGDMLNEIDPSATAKISIVCRKIDSAAFEKKHAYEMKDDGLDRYRVEHNQYMNSILTNASCILQEKYITVTINRKNAEEARSVFIRISNRFSSHLRSKSIGSELTPLNANRRLQIIFDFVRPEDRGYFDFDLAKAKKEGRSFRDYIAPDSYERVDSSCFKFGDWYYRNLYLKDYGSFLKDDFISNLLDINKHMILSIDLIPVPTEEAIKDARNRLMGVEKDIANHSRRQIDNKNFSGNIPYEFETRRNDVINFLDMVSKKDEHVFLGVLTICHSAPTKKELDADTESLTAIARQEQCQLPVLHFQQLDGFRTAIPVGTRCIDAVRSLTTNAVSILNPFRSLDIIDEGGIIYGRNTISNNVISINKKMLKNGNSVILGGSGGGKSGVAKLEILRTMLQDEDCNIIIVDPEREYGKIVEALHGETIEISTGTKTRINAMEINENYGDEVDPVKLKSDFIFSFFEQIMEHLEPEHKSAINRAVRATLNPYVSKHYKGECPTLMDLYETLKADEDPAAQYVRTCLELYTEGSYNMFSEKTNVETTNRLICYDISELGAQSRDLGLLVIMDMIWQRLTKNRQSKKPTYIFLDEFHLLLKHEETSEYFYFLWKRIRKYRGFATGITQNIDDLLNSQNGEAMVANSEFLVLLGQNNTESQKLRKILGLSDTNEKAIKDAPPCHGLIKAGPFFLPFDNTIPKGTETFRLLDTSR